VILNYLGLDYSHLIKGFLQHGLRLDGPLGYWPYQKLPMNYFEFYPVFTWSREAEIQAKQNGHKHVRAIGAPWLYLLATHGLLKNGKVQSVKKDSNQVSLLVVPSHGSGHYFTSSRYELSVSKIRKKIGDIDASVLLYYTEFCDPKIRKLWRDQGFNLESSGMAWGAEHRTLWTYNGGRPNFLANTLNLILGHREVICTYPTTFAAYSSSLGVPTSILIDPEVSENMGVVNEGKGVERLKMHDSKGKVYSLNLLGDTFAKRDISEDKINRSLKYLGIESLESPENLKEILPLIKGMIPFPSETS
jgi:hypothetical protein